MKARTGLTILFFVVTQSFSALAQNHKGLCKVEVDDVTTPIVLKYLNYSVTFKNNASKTVDGITWTAYYYNADELIKKEESSFNATKLIDPIASGFTKTVVRTPRVKNASKVITKIKKVHFFDGSTCD